MLSEVQLSALAEATVAAKSAEAMTGCPAALSVAQWALESGWGSRQPGNNCYGIKPYPGCCGIQMLPTWEVIDGQRVSQRLAFATFPTIQQCFEKHADLIANGPRYQNAWRQYRTDHNLRTLIEGIAIVYATDPDYARKLEAIISMQQVQEALKV